MDKHLSALNEQNTMELAATINFPYFRLVRTTLKVWETADKYFDYCRTWSGENLAYAKLALITPISATTNKVHLYLRLNRFDSRDQLIADFKSIWVITEIKRVSVAQLRYSFALVW